MRPRTKRELRAGSASSPRVGSKLVTGKARYSEPCLSRVPARSAEWVAMARDTHPSRECTITIPHHLFPTPYARNDRGRRQCLAPVMDGGELPEHFQHLD